MSLKSKYQPVLDLGEKLNVTDGYVNEEPGKLKIGGTAETQYDKDQMWDEIKRIGGEQAEDIEADIKVKITDYYTKHTVAGGESLSKISKRYYRDAMKYNQIFEANRNILKNPDMIHPGQELVIPFPS
ncbi:MAG: LysM peptidoglycan-binding domain-containing protein [Bacteroidia bacterium]|nr:LysM peptidoglycan-binding domain-containing protein [Bacteroidia bacterium]NNC86652.1 LysM peptidoglycan-binding domain-containing protein [Bacteroidia bacterium]NNM15858.1 LysM peptidoglycan-binding domain-containing protein [Bacteroidia bacterium]